MLVFIIILLFSICNVRAELELQSNSENDCAGGYYWREYTGEIPKDAIPGGSDVNGKAIYIGQVLDRTFLIPGQIWEADKSTIYFDRGHVASSATERIKILCGAYLEDFEWIKTDNSKIKYLTDKHLILGGYHENVSKYTVYIGRLSKDEQLLVGMVIVCDTDEFGAHIVANGTVATYKSYEVLSYNPKRRVSLQNGEIKDFTVREHNGNYGKNLITINIS